MSSSAVAVFNGSARSPELELSFGFDARHAGTGQLLRDWVKTLPERRWDGPRKAWVATGVGADPDRALRRAGFVVIGPDGQQCPLADYAEPVVEHDQTFGMTSVRPRLLGRYLTGSRAGLPAAAVWRESEHRWLVPVPGVAPEDSDDPDGGAGPPLRFDGTLNGLRELPVTVLAAVDPATADALARNGVTSVFDLLHVLPRRYLDRSQPVAVADTAGGDTVAFLGAVTAVNPPANGSGPATVRVNDAAGTTVTCRWFRAGWVTRRYQTGMPVLVYGRVETWTGRAGGGIRYGMTNPLVDPTPGCDLDAGAALIPVYPSSPRSGLSTWQIRRATAEAVARLGVLTDPVPSPLLARRALPGRATALQNVHTPAKLALARAGRDRLAYDELLRLQLTLLSRRHAGRAPAGIAHHAVGLLTAQLLKGLPFPLTPAQRRAVTDIQADLHQQHPMHRLLQGDVGSGKTLVELHALLTVVEAGSQGLLMAPTEVLVGQHHGEISGRLAGIRKADGAPVTTALLTNKITGAARRQVLAGLADGSIDLVVGTHALLPDRVRFARLGLAVVDEQHKFGVTQRSTLLTKGPDGRRPDLLVATATPLPRTAMLTTFGDMDVTVLDELPPGRAPVETRAVTAADPADRSGPVWELVREQVASGRQAFVVAPTVDDSETKAAAGAAALRDALAAGALQGLRVEVVHGRQTATVRGAVLAGFTTGRVQVLVATTVVEVGVDIPNATVMVITGAENFGLAQLHQLRGRVGRGRHPGICVLVGDPRTSQATARIDAICASTDGFALAEVDLAIRGWGTLLGAAQSGPATDLRVADLLGDAHLVQQARDDATRLLTDDPDLTRHPALAADMAAAVDEQSTGWLISA